MEEGVVVGAVGELATSRTQPLNHHAVDDNCASSHRSYERIPRSALLISFALLLLSCPSYSIQHGMKFWLGTRDKRSYGRYVIRPIKIPGLPHSASEQSRSDVVGAAPPLTFSFFCNDGPPGLRARSQSAAPGGGAAISILFICIVPCDNTQTTLVRVRIL